MTRTGERNVTCVGCWVAIPAPAGVSEVACPDCGGVVPVPGGERTFARATAVAPETQRPANVEPVAPPPRGLGPTLPLFAAAVLTCVSFAGYVGWRFRDSDAVTAPLPPAAAKFPPTLAPGPIGPIVPTNLKPAAPPKPPAEVEEGPAPPPPKSPTPAKPLPTVADWRQAWSPITLTGPGLRVALPGRPTGKPARLTLKSGAALEGLEQSAEEGPVRYAVTAFPPRAGRAAPRPDELLDALLLARPDLLSDPAPARLAELTAARMVVTGADRREWSVEAVARGDWAVLLVSKLDRAQAGRYPGFDARARLAEFRAGVEAVEPDPD